ncbi:hypothetical protein CDD83_3003 [Cordyceps sp. RAO-2017]|nr:hypothetical protein CDD83_3003 [Cordyceps sp. RAO-2017]
MASVPIVPPICGKGEEKGRGGRAGWPGLARWWLLDIRHVGSRSSKGDTAVLVGTCHASFTHELQGQGKISDVEASSGGAGRRGTALAAQLRPPAHPLSDWAVRHRLLRTDPLPLARPPCP